MNCLHSPLQSSFLSVIKKPISWQKKIVLKSADGYDFEVEEAVARQMCLVKYSTYSIDNNEHFYSLPGITKETLVKVIDYCRHHVPTYDLTKLENISTTVAQKLEDQLQIISTLYTSEYVVSFDAKFIEQVDPVLLFNLIQVRCLIIFLVGCYCPFFLLYIYIYFFIYLCIGFYSIFLKVFI